MSSIQGTPTAVVTGGSAGLGLALTSALAQDGWRVVTDARHGDELTAATGALPGVTAIAGDVRDHRHQERLAEAVRRHGQLDLLVHSASELGPMLPLGEVAPEVVADVLATNLLAPLALTQLLLPLLQASGGALVGISSDAAVEHYPTWGAYGASKAALDHLILTLAAESGLRGYAVDPGDLRTAMHQRAFPGEDISDRPLPETVVPHLIPLITGDHPSGRYRVADLVAEMAR
ncbi:SDR family oxidoreductase [Nocardioides panacihumi]|uniref:SDR family oxidoreductase n=1 Tax=Nocardioides panacihumi TaxID=400774 RepID=A0ABN2RSU7_9ACTN